MNQNKIEEFNNLSIFKKMDIHDALKSTTDIEEIKGYYNDFGIETAIIGQSFAINPNTPKEILSELISVDRYINNVLSNPNTDSKIIDTYVTSDKFAHRISILENPKLSQKNLDILCEDKLGMVMWAARDVKKLREATV